MTEKVRNKDFFSVLAEMETNTSLKALIYKFIKKYFRPISQAKEFNEQPLYFSLLGSFSDVDLLLHGAPIIVEFNRSALDPINKAVL